MAGRRLLGALVACLVLASAGCVGEGRELVTIEVWFHEAQGDERSVLEEQVTAFNETNADVTVLLRVLPEVSYAEQVAAAIDEGGLPDLLDLDPRSVRRAIDGDLLGRLDRLLPASALDAVDPALAAVGRGPQDGLYAVPAAVEVSGLVVHRPSVRAAGLALGRTPAFPVTMAELERLVASLAARPETGPEPVIGVIGTPLMTVEGGLVPLLWSAGVGLTPPVDGAARLDSGAGLSALVPIARWLVDGDLAPDPVELSSVVDGTVPVAIGLSGMVDRLDGSSTEEVAFLPMPDAGTGSHGYLASHAWAIPDATVAEPAGASGEPDGDGADGVVAPTDEQRAAARFLTFILEPANARRAATARGAIPVTAAERGSSDRATSLAALARSARPHPDRILANGALERFRELLVALRQGSDVQVAAAAAVAAAAPG